jgi:gluconolactonase
MKVFDGGCVLTEGVAAGPDGFMYFSDITFTSMCEDESGKYPQAGHIWKYDPKTGEATVWRSPSGMSNGLKFDKDGNMIAALGADYGGRMLVKTDMATGKSYILSGLYDGKPYNGLNDVSIDEQGRIYFSDPRYLGHEPIFQPGYAIYRLDPDGAVQRIITDGGKTNGVLVSPDQQTLYVVSNDNGWFDFMRLKEGEAAPAQGHHVLQAYNLAADGTVSNRRVLVDYHPYSGPDGIIADCRGQSVRGHSRREPAGHRSLQPRGQGARLHPDRRRAADQRRLRPRRRERRALRHLGQEPVQDQDGQGRLSAAGQQLSTSRRGRAPVRPLSCL